MNVATLLFMGPSVPYHVLDYAISWARENEGSLHALFIVPKKMPEEGYPFPSDLDEAENITTEIDAVKGIREILKTETRFIEKRANASHIPLRSEILFSPSMEQILARVNQSEIIFIDKNADENPEQMEELEFTMKDIRDNTTRHLLPIGELDRYSDVYY